MKNKKNYYDESSYIMSIDILYHAMKYESNL